jgi:hypothetical protein
LTVTVFKFMRISPQQHLTNSQGSRWILNEGQNSRNIKVDLEVIFVGVAGLVHTSSGLET